MRIVMGVEKMNVTIRTAVPKDEGRIRELFLEMLRTIYHTADVKGYDAGYLDKYWSGGKDRIYVAEDHDEVIAFLSIEVHHEPEDYLYIDDFSVAEGYRNKGIGSELIGIAEAYAKEIGTGAVLLHVEKANEFGIKAIVTPGGSIRDQECIDACNKYGIAMVFTGTRHFKH